MSEERVGGRAGTAAPQGVVCELPNPPLFVPSVFFPLTIGRHRVWPRHLVGAFSFLGAYLQQVLLARRLHLIEIEPSFPRQSKCLLSYDLDLVHGSVAPT